MTKVTSTLVVFILLLCSMQVTGQNRTQAQPCSIPFEQAPAVRGFRLGQGVEEIIAKWPRLRYWYAKSKQIKQDGAYDLPFFMYDNGKKLDLGEELEGVDNMNLAFLDDKLYYLVVMYSEYEPQGINDFIQQASESLGLPASGWRRESASSARLTCKGFELHIQTGKEGGRLEPPALILLDTSAEGELRRRRDERKRLESERQLEKQREEERKRRVFKP
jgi:hypothetical protein